MEDPMGYALISLFHSSLAAIFGLALLLLGRHLAEVLFRSEKNNEDVGLPHIGQFVQLIGLFFAGSNFGPFIGSFGQMYLLGASWKVTLPDMAQMATPIVIGCVLVAKGFEIGRRLERLGRGIDTNEEPAS